jgi:hypothetical protein
LRKKWECYREEDTPFHDEVVAHIGDWKKSDPIIRRTGVEAITGSHHRQSSSNCKPLRRGLPRVPEKRSDQKAIA